MIFFKVVDMGIVSEVIGELENYHITKEALEVNRKNSFPSKIKTTIY